MAVSTRSTRPVDELTVTRARPSSVTSRRPSGKQIGALNPNEGFVNPATGSPSLQRIEYADVLKGLSDDGRSKSRSFQPISSLSKISEYGAMISFSDLPQAGMFESGF